MIYSEFQKVGKFLILKVVKHRAVGNWSYFGMELINTEIKDLKR